MARHVKIATLAPPIITPTKEIVDAVAFVRQHWQACAENVLPEMCDHYSCKTNEEQDAYYRQRGNTILDLWVDIARRHRCHVAYSALCEDKGKWYNLIQVIDRGGNIIGVYNKMHPTIGAVEKDHNQYGDGAVIIKCDFGTAGGVLCFDLNFDDLSREFGIEKLDDCFARCRQHRQDHYKPTQPIGVKR